MPKAYFMQWQIRHLVQVLGGLEGKPRWASVLVHGSAASGKTAVVRAVLESMGYANAYASCLTCTTPSLLFEVWGSTPCIRY